MGSRGGVQPRRELCQFLNIRAVGGQSGSADLSGANLGQADLRDARFCNTVMPDGSVLYSGC
ncbi:MAG: hypothetical protein CMM46_08580 [Rhodospirillaceae bacterium]|nr:hypothetical protein [Rhodospirillaceae bacterium]